MFERSTICMFPRKADPHCGSASTYVNEHCSGEACKAAWRVYNKQRKRRRESVAPEQKVWPFEHGTIENFRAGCHCANCLKAEWLVLCIRMAEDEAFADEAQRLSSFELREPHGMTRAGYARNCRCPLCKIQNSIEQAQRRDSAKVLQLQLQRAGLDHARRLKVNAVLKADPIIDARGGASYEMLDALPDEAAKRNLDEAVARRGGYETI